MSWPLEHHDVALRMRDAAMLQRGQGENRHPHRLRTDEEAQSADVEDPVGSEMVEVLVEGLARVEVALGEREALRGVGAERVGEADVDLVVLRRAAREHRAPVADRGVHVGHRVGRAGERTQLVVDDVADRGVELDDVDVRRCPTSSALSMSRPPPPPMISACPPRSRARSRRSADRARAPSSRGASRRPPRGTGAHAWS